MIGLALAGKTLRAARSARQTRMQDETASMTGVLGFFAKAGAKLTAAREKERPLEHTVTTITSWDELARATAAARALSGLSSKDNFIPFLRDQHARVRKFAVPSLAAFSFEGRRQRRHRLCRP